MPLYLCLVGLFLLCMKYNLQNFVSEKLCFSLDVSYALFLLNKLFENVSVYLTSPLIFKYVQNFTGIEEALKKGFLSASSVCINF